MTHALSSATSDRNTFVLDDDPTGAQSETGVPVVLEWSRSGLHRLAARNPRAIHLLTNSRALDPQAAYNMTFQAASLALDVAPDARLVLRGDSTLRAHLLEEYAAVVAAGYGGRTPLHLLVPALPAAGRMTIDGVHQLKREGGLVPLHRTEYARSAGFAYTRSRLLEWAEERSRGYFRAADGVELSLEELRSDGALAVVTALRSAARAQRPAICAPDAETVDDLSIIAEGLRQAEAEGVGVLVRCAPAFVAVLADTLARGFAPTPQPSAVVAVVGSYVETTQRQLAVLSARRPKAVVRLDARRLLSSRADEIISDAVARLHENLVRERLGVVATSTEYVGSDHGFDDGMLIARRLAEILARLPDRPRSVVSKGGITSAINIRFGLGAVDAEVVGPFVVDGVSLWRHMSQRGERVDHVVFPGNVGSAGDLARVLDALDDR